MSGSPRLQENKLKLMKRKLPGKKGIKDVMMIRVKKEDRKAMAPLFEGLEDSMVIGYLQGFMGSGFVDRLPNPQVGLIISAEYCFLAEILLYRWPKSWQSSCLT